MRRGAPSGNTNAVRNGPHRIAGRPSVSGERLAKLIDRLTAELGHEPGRDEVVKKINDLALRAIDDYNAS
jgi:hypothetical protein